MSGETTQTAENRATFASFEPVKSNPGAGLNGRGHRAAEARDGASFSEPDIRTCPCCNGQVRVVGGRRLEVVRMAKPDPPLALLDLLAPGSTALAKRAVEAVCAANDITLTELRLPGRDRNRAAVRKHAARAARATGANGRIIAAILNRDISTINNIAPRKGSA